MLTAVVALTAGGCAGSPGAALEAERQRLEARQTAFVAAMAERDADAVAGLFAEDGVMHVANMGPVEGRAAIRQFYGNMFGFMSASSMDPEMTHLSPGGDMAYSVGRTTNEFRGPDGPVGYEGKYLLVWRKEAGDDWAIAVYAISGNEPGSNR